MFEIDFLHVGEILEKERNKVSVFLDKALASE
jgi:hypothetical protein